MWQLKVERIVRNPERILLKLALMGLPPFPAALRRSCQLQAVFCWE
jgi:hypothetical protein